MGNAQLNLMNILFNPRYVYIVGHALDCGLYIYFTQSKTKIHGSLKLQNSYDSEIAICELKQLQFDYLV